MGLSDMDGLECMVVREQIQTLAAGISWACTRANIHPDLTDNARAEIRSAGKVLNEPHSASI